VLVLAGNLK